MKKKVIGTLSTLVLGVGLLTGCGQATSGQGGKSGSPKVITLHAQTAGEELTRVQNLVAASKKLNQELKSEGKNMKVVVKTNSFSGSWPDYAKQYMLAFRAKKAPDIYATGHENIGWLANGHYILPLDSLKKSKAYKDVYPSLWKPVTYKGHVYGAPQDTEVRPVFYNKDILKKLGWSDQQIKDLPNKVKSGQFTLQDMTNVAQQAVKKGDSQYGILHRPVNGPDFQEMAYDFGGKIYDSKTGKLILDKAAVLKQLNYFSSLTKKKLTPDNLTSMQWDNVYKMVVNGKSLFYYGGIWNVFNWSQGNYNDKIGKVDAKWVNQHFGMMLIPAAKKGGQPVTLSHPFVYTVSSTTKYPKLVKRLLELVANPKLQVNHDIKTYHLPVTKSAAANKKFQANPTLSKVTYMLKYTTFLPDDNGYTKYSKDIFDAIQAVELGKKTPKQALNDAETQLKNDLGNNLEIK